MMSGYPHRGYPRRGGNTTGRVFSQNRHFENAPTVKYTNENRPWYDDVSSSSNGGMRGGGEASARGGRNFNYQNPSRAETTQRRDFPSQSVSSRLSPPLRFNQQDRDRLRPQPANGNNFVHNTQPRNFIYQSPPPVPSRGSNGHGHFGARVSHKESHPVMHFKERSNGSRPMKSPPSGDRVLTPPSPTSGPSLQSVPAWRSSFTNARAAKTDEASNSTFQRRAPLVPRGLLRNRRRVYRTAAFFHPVSTDATSCLPFTVPNLSPDVRPYRRMAVIDGGRDTEEVLAFCLHNATHIYNKDELAAHEEVCPDRLLPQYGSQGGDF